MNVQLIYKTGDVRAIAWFRDLLTVQQRLNDEWQGIIRDLTDAYGMVKDEPRSLVIREGLVGGFLAAPGGLAPDGWTLSVPWGGFIPDTSTAIGLQWQDRIDDLPAHENRNPNEIGMPGFVEIEHNGEAAGTIVSVLHMPDGDDCLYGLWPERNIKPLIDQIVAAASANEIIWSEVKRSDWYTLVEASEARAAAIEAGAP